MESNSVYQKKQQASTINVCINRKAILIIKHSHNVMKTYKLHCLASSFPCSNSSLWPGFCLPDIIMLHTPSCTRSV